MKRVFNFNAGPSPMPIEVLEEMKNDLTDFRGTGMGITEISHRSPVFQDMLDETKAYLRQMMKLDDDYEIVFMQGGGTMQFLMTGQKLRLYPGHLRYPSRYELPLHLRQQYDLRHGIQGLPKG